MQMISDREGRYVIVGMFVGAIARYIQNLAALAVSQIVQLGFRSVTEKLRRPHAHPLDDRWHYTGGCRLKTCLRQDGLSQQ